MPGGAILREWSREANIKKLLKVPGSSPGSRVVASTGREENRVLNLPSYHVTKQCDAPRNLGIVRSIFIQIMLCD